MKKSSIFLTLFVFMIAFCSVVSLSKDVDLTGTWKGSTIIPDQGEDEMTLVIKKEKGEYTATITDSFDMLLDTECEDFEFKDGTLTFNVTVDMDMESMTVWITLDVKGDTMKGQWETVEGDIGDIELIKQ